MKRAIWLPNWIGDAVMATPALRLIRDAFPDDRLIGIYRPPVQDTLAGTGLLDDLLLDGSNSKNSWRQQAAFIKLLRQKECDEILLLTNSFRTAAVARLTGIQRRIGFRRDGRGWLLTERLEPKSKHEPHPALDEYLRLAGQMIDRADVREVSRQLELQTGPEDELLWEDFAARHCLDAGSYICLNSGGAFGAAKHWPIEHFASLAKRIVAQYELPVVMLCGPAERELAEKFRQLTAHPQIHSLADEALSIGLSKAMVKYSRAMITTDSGPRHFAAAFDVPVITLFGPTHIAWSETNFADAIHLQEQMDCGPCQQRICPLGHHNCMRDLTPDRVLAALSRLFNREDQHAA